MHTNRKRNIETNFPAPCTEDCPEKSVFMWYLPPSIRSEYVLRSYQTDIFIHFLINAYPDTGNIQLVKSEDQFTQLSGIEYLSIWV